MLRGLWGCVMLGLAAVMGAITYVVWSESTVFGVICVVPTLFLLIRGARNFRRQGKRDAPPPTAKQIAFANELGIKLKPGMNKWSVSREIDKALDERDRRRGND